MCVCSDILMSNAKTLVEDTKKLVASAAGTQEQLAAAAESIVVTVQGIANAAKDGAAAIGPDDKEAQVCGTTSTCKYWMWILDDYTAMWMIERLCG